MYSCVCLGYFQILVGLNTTASSLLYEPGVNDEKMLMETGILLIKMDIAHFTLVNLKILTV